MIKLLRQRKFVYGTALAAGIFEMSYWQFQVANFVSALVWSAALLLFGDVIGQVIEWLWRTV